MLKRIILPFIYTVAILIPDTSSNKSLASCTIPDQGIYGSIFTKIDQSDIADTNELSCEKIKEINMQSPDAFIMTSGRKRGKYTICLSDDSYKPCKYVVGKFKENRNPSDMLSQVFGLPKTKPGQLNETVERLFFKPSLLID